MPGLHRLDKRIQATTFINKEYGRALPLTKDKCMTALKHEQESVKFIADPSAYEMHREQRLKEKYV